MSQLFLVMNSQQAWELNQVYRDHVVSGRDERELVVSNVRWRGLPGTDTGVAAVTLEAATTLSFRESGDARAFAQAGRRADAEKVRQTFGSRSAGNRREGWPQIGDEDGQHRDNGETGHRCV